MVLIEGETIIWKSSTVQEIVLLVNYQGVTLKSLWWGEDIDEEDSIADR